MEEKISKECLQHLVNGLNCHYNSNFIIKENDDNLIIFNNNENNFDLTESLHLKFVKNNNEFSISLINYKDSKLTNTYKNSNFFNPEKMLNGGLKLISAFGSNDICCSTISLSSEAICIMIKYKMGML